MGFLQTIQKDLEQSLAEQRRAALVVVLRQRASAMTFDDLRQFLFWLGWNGTRPGLVEGAEGKDRP